MKYISIVAWLALSLMLTACERTPSGPGFDFDPSYFSSLNDSERLFALHELNRCYDYSRSVRLNTKDYKVYRPYDERSNRLSSLIESLSLYHVCDDAEDLSKFTYCMTINDTKKHLQSINKKKGDYCSGELWGGTIIDNKSKIAVWSECVDKTAKYIEEAVWVTYKENINQINFQTSVFDGDMLAALQYLYAKHCPL